MSQILPIVKTLIPHIFLAVVDATYLHLTLRPKFKSWAVFLGLVVLSVGLMTPSIINAASVKYFSILYYLLRTVYMAFMYKGKAGKRLLIIVLLYICLFGSEILTISIGSAMHISTPTLQLFGMYIIEFLIYGGLLAIIVYYSDAMNQYKISKRNYFFVLIPISQLLLLSSTIVYENLNRIVNNFTIDPLRRKVDIFFISFYAVTIVFSFAADILALRGFLENMRLQELEIRAKSLEIQNEANLRYYTQLKQSTSDMKKIKHDFMNILQSISALVQDGDLKNADSIQSLYNTLVQRVNHVQFSDYCSNSLVNAICSTKMSECKDEQIQLDIRASMGDQSRIADLDLCRVLVNMLDNSMEAVASLPVEERKIEVDLFIREQYLYIRTLNPSARPLQTNTHTSKKEKQNHGLGTQILKEIAAQYDGEFLLSQENGQVSALWTGKSE